MERISLIFSELFQAGIKSSEIFEISKPRVTRSGVFKILKTS